MIFPFNSSNITRICFFFFYLNDPFSFTIFSFFQIFFNIKIEKLHGKSCMTNFFILNFEFYFWLLYQKILCHLSPFNYHIKYCRYASAIYTCYYRLAPLLSDKNEKAKIWIDVKREYAEIFLMERRIWRRPTHPSRLRILYDLGMLCVRFNDVPVCFLPFFNANFFINKFQINKSYFIDRW